MSKKPTMERELKLKTDEEEYGIVNKELGSSQFLITLNLRNKQVVGKLRGNLRGKSRNGAKAANRVEGGSIVIVGSREFQTANKKGKYETVDIVYVYNPTEARQLKKIGEYIETEDDAEREEEETEDIFDFSEL